MDCNLAADGAIIIAESLKINKSLHTLNISNNEMMD